MRLAVVALVIITALAGCAAPAADVEPNAVVDAAGRLAFGEPTGMAQPTSGAEPNLIVAPDGTLWIAAVAGSQDRPNAVEGAAWLWRSTDGGATWETLREPVRETPLGSLPMTRRPFGSSDADVVASPDGWVYYTDWWNWGAPVAGTPRAGNYLVERSSDGGATWQSAPVTIPDPTSIDRQWLVAGPDGFVGLFYAYFHPVENTGAGVLPSNAAGLGRDIMSIRAVYSRDHGASWSTPVTVVPPEEGVGYQIAHPRLAPDGALVMPYGYVDYEKSFWTDPSEVRLAVSQDGGRTWEQRVVAHAPSGFDNLWAVQGAVDAAGTVFVAWSAREGLNMTTFLAESADLGATWGEPVRLRSAGLNFLPWVDAVGDGRVAVAWYGSDATGDPTKAEGAAWFPYVAVRDGAGAPFAVARASEAPVKEGPLCPRGASCASDRELLDYPSVAFAPDGTLHVAYATSREVDGAKAGLVHHVAARLS